MSHESKIRNGFLATISVAIALITAYAIADPQVGNHRVADFAFPDEIPLANWDSLSSESLAIATDLNEDGESIEAARRYLYRQNELNLMLEIRYLVGTRGNIASLLTEYLEFSPATQQVKKIKGVGSYLLVEYENSNQGKETVNYLSSCLTSFGHSIVEQKEFSEVLNQVKLTPELFWNWLWGKDSLRDRRCLWVSLSLVSGQNESAHEDLEQAWLDLHQWWQPRFPEL
ncbi:MAG: cyanoexosortase A system-associated protein [Cyanobacteria bacterium P01_F01_bin.143]